MAIPFSTLTSDEIKPGVDLTDMNPNMRPVVNAARRAYRSIAGTGIVITSGRDGVHSANSLHYVGKALDLRTRHIAEDKRAAVAQRLRDDLGPEYDVVVERTHIHVEHDPK